jgi:hypothetical protein
VIRILLRALLSYTNNSNRRRIYQNQIFQAIDTAVSLSALMLSSIKLSCVCVSIFYIKQEDRAASTQSNTRKNRKEEEEEDGII